MINLSTVRRDFSMIQIMLKAAGSRLRPLMSLLGNVFCHREIIDDALINVHVSPAQDRNIHAYIIYVTNAGLISVLLPPGSFVMINHTLRDCG